MASSHAFPASTGVIKYLSLFALLVLVSGCAQLQEWGNWEDDESQSTVAEERSAEPSEYSYRQVVQWLQSGEFEPAETSLKARVESHPEDQRAQSLLEQLHADPETYLGSQSFYYEIQSGDTLSTIAQRFLDDNRQFLILARYNDISVPGQLRAGQRIRIPGEEPAEVDALTEEADSPRQAWAYIESGEPQKALELLEATPESELSADDKQTLSEAHEAWVEKALAQGELPLAETRLANARAAEPSGKDWSPWLDEVAERLHVETRYQHGRAHMADNPMEAATAFTEVLESDPNHGGAQAGTKELKDTVVPKLHREAILLYRNHELEDAIEIWSSLLLISPDFEPAQAYKARARELLARLDDLD